MKRKILIVVLCLACVATYGQTKKRRRKPTPPPVVKQDTTASTGQSARPGGAGAVDTTKKVAQRVLKPSERPLDGYYKKTNILSAKVTPYPNLRESDVAFAKRIWRDIDVREKMNRYLASPKQRLIDVLLNAIAAGELTAYDANPDVKIDPGGDGFTRPLTPEAAKATLSESSLVEKRDANNNIISSKLVAGEPNPDSLVKFRLKEDWVFDKQRSMFEPRIVGIAPMMKIKGATGVMADYQPAFWIYFPDARQVLAVKEVVSANSDATGLSFDDIFMKRLFTSYIVKESNDKDERIKDYMSGIDKLYESERIKKSLMDWELNLWSY